MDPTGSERRLAAIMFSDIVGYTALMAGSEAAGLGARERHRAVLAPLAARYRGEIVDENGDELVSVFPSAFDAVNCALAAQAALSGDEVELRIGIHLGDVLFQEGRLYGDGVNVASRIRALAEPGGVCVSDEVQHSVQNQANVETRSLGDHSLRNVPRAVTVYAVSGTAQPPRSAATVRSGQPRRAVWAFAVVAALSLAMALVYGVGRQASNAPVRSIAVLPLQNLSGDPAQDYLADGMTEALIARLARVGDLRVISRTSVMYYREHPKPLGEIAAELDVEGIVEGSIQRSGDRVRVTAQLIHAASDAHLWAESYDRELTDVLELQSELARAIVDEIHVALTPDERARLERAEVIDPAAHEAFVLGYLHWGRRSPEDIELAIGYFQRAIELAPDWADAHAALAVAYAISFTNSGHTDPAVAERASASAERALALDPDQARAHAARGLLAQGQWRWEDAEEAYRRALALAPGDAFLYFWYALLLRMTDRMDAAVEAIDTARKLDPLAVHIAASASFIYVQVGDLERAERTIRSAFVLDPAYPWAHMRRARVRMLRGDCAGALEDVRTARQRPIVAMQWGYIAEVLARCGEQEAARAVIAELEEDLSRHDRNVSAIARAYIALREWDTAFEWLGRGVEERTPMLGLVINARETEEVRDDPRYLAIKRDMGLVDAGT